MKTYTIPLYTYLKDSVTNIEKQFATKYMFICCDELYNRFNEQETGGVIWDEQWLNKTEHNPAGVIDAYLNYPILANGMPSYVLFKPDSPTVSDLNLECRQRVNMMFSMAQYCRVNIVNLVVDTTDYTINTTENSLVNGEELNFTQPIQIGYWNTSSYPNVKLSGKGIATPRFDGDKVSASPPYKMYGSIGIYPEDIFDGNTINEKYIDNPDFHVVNLHYSMEFQYVSQPDDLFINGKHVVDYCKNFYVGHNTYGTLEESAVIVNLKDIDLTGSLINVDEDDDPYSELDESETGGGDGSMNPISIDSVDPAVIPSLPSISVTDLGLITMYNPTASAIKLLSDFLWSGVFDPSTFKKLFADPMQALIGLAIVPVSPTLAGSQNITIGSVDTGVSAAKCASNWVQLDCGSVDIEKYVGNFMDADPYTEIQIYLPFIGIRKLSADDINGGTIRVVYNIDILTGACACFIAHNTRGVLYTYNGSCITNVPLTSQNFSGAIQNAVSAVISGIGVAAGAATGAAPITAMGATGLLNSAANAALNSKPQIQRSGNLGGSAGILSILKPYVIIERPSISVPAGLNSYVGNTCNITYPLGVLSGFTMVEYIHIEDCPGTTEEVAEIESLLHQGVYL